MATGQEIKDEIAKLQATTVEEKAEVAAKLGELSDKITALQATIEEMKTRGEATPEELADILATVQSLNASVEEISGDVAPPDEG